MSVLLKVGIRIISLVTSLVSAVIVMVGISTQPIMSLFCGKIPSPLAWILSVGGFYYAYKVQQWSGWYMILFVLGCIAFGIVGTPLFLYNQRFNPKPQRNNSRGNTFMLAEDLQQPWMDKIQSIPVLGHLFTLFLVPLAVLDSFFGCGDRLWKFIFRGNVEFYDDKQLYGEEVQNAYPKELWIHVNGINTDLESAKENCRIMHKMFGRPVHLLHNPTDGFILDLLECMMGKTGLLKRGCTEPRKKLREILVKEMTKKDSGMNNAYDKIVLIAHSQGTIITGNVIADLTDIADGKPFGNDWFQECDTEEEKKEKVEGIKYNLEKIEVYLFAGCAHHVTGTRVKHIECISNRGDVVAILGHLFPKLLQPFWRNTRGNGIVYDQNCKSIVDVSNWGHDIEGNYLDQFKEGLFSESKLVQEYWLDGPKEKIDETTKLL